MPAIEFRSLYWKHLHWIDEICLYVLAKPQLNPSKIYREKRSWSCKSMQLSQHDQGKILDQWNLKYTVCTNHVEKAALATPGLLSSVDFVRIELTFGRSLETYLIDPMLVFPAREIQWFGISSSLKWTGSRVSGWLLPALSPSLVLTITQMIISQNNSLNSSRKWKNMKVD